MPAYDPLEQLTIAELDAASRLLKTDIVTAIGTGTMNRWAGMAIVAYVMAKRTDPAARLDTYRAMTPAELTAALGYPSEADDDDDDARPAGRPAGLLIDDDDDEAEVEVEPGATLEGDGPHGLDVIREKVNADPTGRTRG